MVLFELFNTETEEVESRQEMLTYEASEKNRLLCEKGSPQRWLPVAGEVVSEEGSS